MLKLVARSYLGYGIQKDMGVQVSLLVDELINLFTLFLGHLKR